MEKLLFQELLLKTGFCCMASDGIIADSEIELIKKLCIQLPELEGLDFNAKLHEFAKNMESKGKIFINEYLHQLQNALLSTEENLSLIDMSIQTIKADNIIDYSEIQFFKNIRHRLTIDDETILGKFPDIDNWLEEDIMYENEIDKLTDTFFDSFVVPHFNEKQLKQPQL